MAMSFMVDDEKCTGCGLCATDCPRQIIRLKDNRPSIVPGGEKSCIRCQHCFAVCPAGAISIFGLRAADSRPFGLIADSERLANLLRYRRSVRRFRNRDLSHDEINELLDVLRFSPTGRNDHRTAFQVVSGRVKMEDLRRKATERILAAIDQGTLPPAFELLRALEMPLRRGGDALFRGAPHLIIASSPQDAPCPAADAVIALAQFELLAQSKNIGTTWCGIVMMIFALAPDLMQEFGIPDGFRPGYAMLFGESAVHYARLPQPKPLDVRFI